MLMLPTKGEVCRSFAWKNKICYLSSDWKRKKKLMFKFWF